jgi:hypothetical protein
MTVHNVLQKIIWYLLHDDSIYFLNISETPYFDNIISPVLKEIFGGRGSGWGLHV